MAGILSKPPTKQVRVSPGVYRDASGRPQATKRGKAPKVQALGGLTKQQNQSINQRQTADISLGDTANAQLDDVNKAYAQPMDWSQLPQAPVTGDYNQWVEGQMGNYNKAFDQRFDPKFQREQEDFEQSMANRGVPVGSALYNQQRQEMLQAQNDAKTQAYAAGQSQATSNAGQLFGIGTQARDNALGEAQMRRNMPLTEFNALMASRSGFDTQNLGYSQQRGLQQQQGQIAKSMPRGGGGAPAPKPWELYGFSGPAELDAYETARQRDQAQWQWQNAPQPAKGPSAGAQVGGQLLGTGLGLLGSYAAKNWF